MFDFGLSTSHILVIVVLAIIAIGPKDLPVVLRRFGQFMNKMRGMAREFQSHVDVAMKDAGMEGVQQDLKSLRSGITTAMAPVQTMMASTAASIAAPATPTGPGPTVSTQTTSASDFARMFEAGFSGETRVQGRALEETQP